MICSVSIVDCKTEVSPNIYICYSYFIEKIPLLLFQITSVYTFYFFIENWDLIAF